MIDTQVLIWWLSDLDKLKDKHIAILEDPKVNIEVSVCSLFEIAIKKSLGKLKFDFDIKKVLPVHGLILLNITYEHLEHYLKLPLFHKDPFDRMIIAQAIADNKPLISYDQVFGKYNVLLI